MSTIFSLWTLLSLQLLFSIAQCWNDLFECPPAGEQELPVYKTEFVNCQNLTKECALRHKDNHVLLAKIRAINCEKDSLKPTSLLESTEEVLLSVVSEETATELIERFVCKGESPHSNYLEICSPQMFFTRVSCSIQLLKSFLVKEVTHRKPHHILRAVNPKLFNGLRSSNEPILSAEETENFLQIVLVANDFGIDKSTDYMRSLLEGPFEKPLRTTLDKQGLYIDYEKDDKESFVHICQAFRQHLFVEVKSDLGKYLDGEFAETDPKKIARLKLGWNVIGICNEIIDPEPKFLLLAIIIMILVVYLAFYLISRKMCNDEKLKERPEKE